MGREVVQQRPPADAGTLLDLQRGGASAALLDEQRHRRLQNVLAGGRRLGVGC
ncbi:hypothetical protein D9M69_566010 [compost metagenome]